MSTTRGSGRRPGSIAGRHLARNAVAYLALVVATSGTAYAAATIGSPQVVDNSLKSVDLRDGAAVKGADVVNGSLTGGDVRADSLTGREVREPSLGEVPRATLAGRRIDYGKVVGSGASDTKVVLSFRGIELFVGCFGSGGGNMIVNARSTNENTFFDWLWHQGLTSSDERIAFSFQGGGWLSTSGSNVGEWKRLAKTTFHGQRGFMDVYFQWAGGTMTVRLVTKVFDNGNGTATCFVTGTATSGA